MLRLKRLAVLNVVAICVITGFFAWVMHLPAPETHSGQSLSGPAQGAPAPPAEAAGAQEQRLGATGQTGAPGVTIAGPEYSEPAAAGQQTLGLELLPAGGTHAVSITDFAIDAGWLARTAAQTGIPARALQAYAAAAGAANVATPGCGIGWNTLAAIGWIESGHGTHGGGELTPARPWRGRPAYCFRAEAASGTLWKATLGARVGRDTAAAWPPYRAKASN